MIVLRQHLEGASLDDLLLSIPKETEWVWRMLDVFEK